MIEINKKYFRESLNQYGKVRYDEFNVEKVKKEIETLIEKRELIIQTITDLQSQLNEEKTLTADNLIKEK